MGEKVGVKRTIKSVSKKACFKSKSPKINQNFDIYKPDRMKGPGRSLQLRSLYVPSNERM